jgi:hypothetical protein
MSLSPQWAHRQVEPYLGLPFGAYLRSMPPARPRRLTGPLDPAQDSVWHKVQVFCYLEAEQRSDDQQDSGFVSRLPYDVRIIIYEMVLGGKVFHCSAQNQKSRITHFECNHPDRIDDEGARHKCSNDWYGPSPSSNGQEARATVGLLSLLLTCRKVYSEAIGTLYSSNTFVYSQNFAAFRFLKFMIPPQRLPCLRQFRLHMRIPPYANMHSGQGNRLSGDGHSVNSRATRDWIDLWRFFATQMTGLQVLYLELQMLQPTEAQIKATPDDEAESWIEPIVMMAYNAQRDRGCRVEVETRGVRHFPAQMFVQAQQENPGLDDAEVMRRSCAALHQRIRLSLG